MISNVISWTEVIKHRHMKQDDMEPSPVGSDRKEAVTDDKYLFANDSRSGSRGEGFTGNDFNDNIIRNTYPYLGTNQTIECQIIPG